MIQRINEEYENKSTDRRLYQCRDVVTEEQVREAVLFQLGWGGMDADNPIGEPDWDDIDVDVEL